VPARAAHDRRLDRQLFGQDLGELEFDELDRVAVGRGGRVRRIVDGECVERIAVPRRVDLGFDDRQSAPAEETADPREEILLVG
jgi:hypothetical protein